MSDNSGDAASKNSTSDQASQAATNAATEIDPPRESFSEILRTVVYALLIALVFRTLLFQPFSIPSGSMKPTLLIGDYLFVSKYAYGYSKHSLPYGNLLPDSVFGGRLFSGEPERGDVIVFRGPANDNIDYIKRVVGLPGDSVQVIRGVLHINGKPVELTRAPSFEEPRLSSVRPAGDGGQRCATAQSAVALGLSTDDTAKLQQPIETRPCLKARFTETLPNGVSYAILDTNGPLGSHDNTGRFRVPEGHYFFMGDNRDNSLDSRANIGFVPAQFLVGRAEMILLSSEGAFWELWKWRGDRFFKSIE